MSTWQWILFGILILICLAATSRRPRRPPDPDPPELDALDDARVDSVNGELERRRQAGQL